MAEVLAMRNNALPYPIYAVPFTIVLPLFDNDGDLVTAPGTLDSEVSKNGDTPADCTNEATQIGTSGKYYLTLTGAEMTADVVDGVTKTSATDAKTTPWTLYPRKLVSLRSGTSAGGAVGYITLDAAAGARDDRWNGCLVVATIDGNVEARIITDYTGSNQQAAVTPDWNVAPDADDTFVIYLPEGMQSPTVNVAHVSETAQTAGDLAARLPAALVSGRIDSHVGSMADAVMAAAKFASGAFDAVWSVAARLLTAGTNIVLAKGTGVTGFNDPTVGATADAVWDEVMAGHLTGGTTGASLNGAGSAGDPWTTALPGAYGAGTAGAIVGAPLTAAGVRTAVGLASANLDTQLAALWTTAMTEGYAADGAAPTPAQALFMILQSLHEFSISGVTRTVKKLDGSTTAMTFTFNDATTPTSSTRAS